MYQQANKNEYSFRDLFTRFCIRCIIWTNKSKDRHLSQSLFELAEIYNTRPGEMNYVNSPDLMWDKFCPKPKRGSVKCF